MAQRSHRTFTNWLESPRVRRRLGDALGLELERDDDLGRWGAIGSYTVPTQGKVLVVPQQDEADDQRLADLIQFAFFSMYKPSVCHVWLASEFSSSYVDALNWLNAIGQRGVNYWAISVKPFGTRPFRVVSSPQNASLVPPPPAVPLVFWCGLASTPIMRDVGLYWANFYNGRRMEFPGGRGGLYYAADRNVRANELSAQLLIRRAGAGGWMQLFRRLESTIGKRLKRESAVDCELRFETRANTVEVMSVVTSAFDLSSVDEWPRQLVWVAGELARLYEECSGIVEHLPK